MKDQSVLGEMVHIETRIHYSIVYVSENHLKCFIRCTIVCITLFILFAYANTISHKRFSFAPMLEFGCKIFCVKVHLFLFI